MLNRPEFKVGIVFIICFVMTGYMSMKAARGVGFFQSVKVYKLKVKDAAGIIANTPIKMAGVKVGTITGINLEEGLAVLTLSVDKKFALTQGAQAQFKSDGILGTRHVAVYPGPIDSPAIADGDVVPLREGAGGGMGGMMKQISGVAESLKEIADAIKNASVTGTTETPIGRIMTNMEMLTEDLAEVSRQNKESIRSVFSKLDGVLSTLNDVLGEAARPKVNEAMDHVYGGLERFDQALANLEEMSQKVNDGEGSLGRLLNDDETINGVNEVMANLNQVLGQVRTLRTSIDYHSEMLTENQDMRTFVGLRLQPGSDRYYEFAMVQDPYGVEHKKRVLVEGSTSEDYTETVTYEDRIKVTALFAKNFYDFTLKGGLIEGKGGFGVDYMPFGPNKLRLSAEVFDFKDANLRLFARYNIYSGIYLMGGYNSILNNRPGISSPFFGAGLFLRNSDLAALAAFAFNR